MSIDEARSIFWEGIKQPKGICCPVCERHGQMYKRSMNRGMAKTLIWLYQHANPNYRHLSREAPRYVLTDNQVGKLTRFWGFAEAKPNDDDPTKLRSGIYRITPSGVAFIEGRIQANAFCYEYHKRVHSWSAEMITMSGALGVPFDYRDLTKDLPPP